MALGSSVDVVPAGESFSCSDGGGGSDPMGVTRDGISLGSSVDVVPAGESFSCSDGDGGLDLLLPAIFM